MTDHGAHGELDSIGGVCCGVGLSAARVERLLDALLVRVVMQGLGALVLIAHGVTRAALRHEDGLFGHCGVA